MSSNTLDIVARRDGDANLHRELFPTSTQFSSVHDTSSPKHVKPVLFVADADPLLRRGLTAALKRRFGADYLVHSAATPEAGLRTLRRLHDEAAEVALVSADLWLPGSGGIEFLSHARECYPRAQCIVLTTIGDDAVSESLQRALALGHVDRFVEKPWRSPEEWLYPQLSEALADWWRANRPLFERVRVIGPLWDSRSHELRDLGTRNGIPFGFYPTDSAEGQRLLDEHVADSDQVSILVLVDDKVLVDPSNGEIAEALGLATHPGLRH